MRSFRAAAAGRADKLVGEMLPGRGRRLLARVFDEGKVRVNGRRARKGDLIAAGDLVEFEEPAELSPAPEPDLPLAVIHVDEALVALDKPAGMATTPLLPGERGTLAGALVARYPECADAGGDPREAGFAHRLDAGTTGVVIAARARDAWTALRESFHAGRVRKEYLALVVGEVTAAEDLEAPIAHDPGGGVRVGASARALPAHTRVEPIARLGGRTLLRCEARTGRMHQVRAHLAARGWPIVGDVRYGGPAEPAITGHFLHAARLELPHPATGKRLDLDAPLPADRARLVGAFSSGAAAR